MGVKGRIFKCEWIFVHSQEVREENEGGQKHTTPPPWGSTKDPPSGQTHSDSSEKLQCFHSAAEICPWMSDTACSSSLFGNNALFKEPVWSSLQQRGTLYDKLFYFLYFVLIDWLLFKLILVTRMICQSNCITDTMWLQLNVKNKNSLC